MKLGKLLLRGLSRKPKKRAAPRKPGVALKRTSASRPTRIFAPPKASPPRIREVPVPAQVQAPSLARERLPAPLQAPATPQSLPSSVVAPRSRPAAEPQQHTLTTQNLYRPDEELRHRIEAFLLDQRSEHTRTAYGRDLKRFLKFLVWRASTQGPEPIHRAVIIAYKEQLLAEGLEHTTVDRHLATLRSFFRWLVDDGVLDRNPAEGVRFLNPGRLSRTAGFSDEEVRKVLALPDLHSRVGALHHAVLMILFHCGLRRSELCSLRTSQTGVERGHRVIRLRGKGNTERIVVVVPQAWKAVEHYFRITQRSLDGDEPLFTAVRAARSGDGPRPLDPSLVFYIVRKYARQAGIAQNVSPHSCRATAISNARDHQVPDRAIQEFAGWASPDMITRYDKRKSSVEKSAALAIDYGADSGAEGPIDASLEADLEADLDAERV